jgi:cobalt-zinc-cadmium efflux system protein
VHAHHHTRAADGVMKIALLATLALVITEFVVGVLAHSLALISDGWHNFSDLPTLVLSWVALYFEQKSPDRRKTFGYQRAGVLAAFVNGLILVAVALFIGFEGYGRLMHPQPVASNALIAVGLVALLINGGISWALAGERRDLNLRAVFIHNLGDAISNVAIIGGGWLIGRTGQMLIDPILAFLIAGMILWSAVGILTESSNILLESAPKGINVERVATAMLAVPGVREVHDVHLWSLGSQSHALACHILILDMPTSGSELIAHQVREVLHKEFDITHTTIQFEHTHGPGDFHRYMPDAEPSPLGKNT